MFPMYLGGLLVTIRGTVVFNLLFSFFSSSKFSYVFGFILHASVLCDLELIENNINLHIILSIKQMFFKKKLSLLPYDNRTTESNSF